MGHVACVTAASNLRSVNYGIPSLDVLEVQRVSGKIIPALATTTSLIAGMVSLEVMKIASERVYARQLLSTNRSETEVLAANFQRNDTVVDVQKDVKEAIAVDVEACEVQEVPKNKNLDNSAWEESSTKVSLMKKGNAFFKRMTRSFFRPVRKHGFIFRKMEKEDDESEDTQEISDVVIDNEERVDRSKEEDPQSLTTSAIWATHATSLAATHYQRTRNRWLLGSHSNVALLHSPSRERLLKRFRNTYVNLALPMVSFTQLVAANPTDDDHSFIYNSQDLQDEERNQHVYFLPTNERVVPSLATQIHDILHPMKPHPMKHEKKATDAIAKRVSLWEELHVPKLLRYREEVTLWMDETSVHRKKKPVSVLAKKLLTQLLTDEAEQDTAEDTMGRDTSREVTLSDVFSYLRYRYPDIRDIVAVTDASQPDHMWYANFLPALQDNLHRTVSQLVRDTKTHRDSVTGPQEESTVSSSVRLLITVSLRRHSDNQEEQEDETDDSLEVTLPPVVVSYTPNPLLDSLKIEQDETVLEELLLGNSGEDREMDLLNKISQDIRFELEEVEEEELNDIDGEGEEEEEEEEDQDEIRLEEVIRGTNENNDKDQEGDSDSLLAGFNADTQTTDPDTVEEEDNKDEDKNDQEEESPSETDNSETVDEKERRSNNGPSKNKRSWTRYVKEMVKMVLFDEDESAADLSDDGNTVDE